MQEEKIEVSLVYKSDEDFFTEKIDAIKVGDFYQIAAVPAFATNLAYGDLIKVEYENNEYHFEELIQESGHSTIHIVLFDTKENDIAFSLEDIGCGVNKNVTENYLVIDVPPLVSFLLVKQILEEKRIANKIDYKEACLSKVHRVSSN